MLGVALFFDVIVLDRCFEFFEILFGLLRCALCLYCWGVVLVGNHDLPITSYVEVVEFVFSGWIGCGCGWLSKLLCGGRFSCFVSPLVFSVVLSFVSQTKESND